VTQAGGGADRTQTVQIGIDVGFLARDNRGMGRYVRNVLRVMLSGTPQHDFVLFCRDERDMHPTREALGQAGLDTAGPMLTSLAGLKGRRTDVCWYPWNRIDRPAVGRQNVVTLHDVAPFAFPYRSILRRLDQMADERRLRRSAAIADLIYTDSEFSKREISRYLAVSPELIQAIPLGVDERFCARPPSAADAKLLSRLGVADGYVLAVGATDERKNLERLLQAWQVVKSGGASAHKLLVCGMAAETLSAYEDAAQDVVAGGFVSDGELSILYRHATVFAFPSLYEGFGLPVLEAMASGAPVLCARAASLPEVAGDAAAYCDPQDADDIARHLELLLAHRGLRQQLSYRGLERARKYTWAAAASAILGGFEDLAGDQATSKGARRVT